MNISKIKHILDSGEVLSNQVNPIINTLEVYDLDKLSKCEKDNLRCIISNMLILIQDPSSGAHLDNPEKAELLLSAIEC